MTIRKGHLIRIEKPEQVNTHKTHHRQEKQMPISSKKTDNFVRTNNGTNIIPDRRDIEDNVLLRAEKDKHGES